MTFDPFAPDSARQLTEPEEMDTPGVDGQRLVKALRFIRRINYYLGYLHSTAHAVTAMVASIKEDRPITVLDVATGSGDIAVRLPEFAAFEGKQLQVIGLDLHGGTLKEARRFTQGHLPLVQGDALSLPFADASIDIVITSMFLHHLPTELAVAALREMNRVARVGIIAADLIRDRRAHRWVVLFTLLADRMVAHDARVSVKQAFTIAEAEELAKAAGLRATVSQHFGHRFIISALKSEPDAAQRRAAVPSPLEGEG